MKRQRRINTDGDTEHKAMFAATQEPTDIFNGRLKNLRHLAQNADDAYEAARLLGNDDGNEKADHDRRRVAEEIGQMTEFKAGLARFAEHTHILHSLSILVTDLENFAAFANCWKTA